MRGGGFGLIGDLIVGLIGAFIGDWLLPRLNIHFGTGIVALIVNAVIGAIFIYPSLDCWAWSRAQKMVVEADEARVGRSRGRTADLKQPIWACALAI